jgi:hypothetical protein
MGDGKERNSVELDSADARLLSEGNARPDMAGFVRAEGYGSACKE